VAKYMAKRRRPPSQGWRTFVHNHDDAIASIDMFVVPTISFGTATALYGAAFIRRIRAMGIRDRPVSARSPWQSGYAERLIGSIRRECLDHIVVVGERHLRHVLASYQNTTTRSERTYRCRRTRRFGVMCAEQGAWVRRPSWAGYTMNMFEFEFPAGTGDPGGRGERPWIRLLNVRLRVRRAPTAARRTPRLRTGCAYGPAFRRVTAADPAQTQHPLYYPGFLGRDPAPPQKRTLGLAVRAAVPGDQSFLRRSAARCKFCSPDHFAG
jgi:hypothetical protein